MLALKCYCIVYIHVHVHPNHVYMIRMYMYIYFLRVSAVAIEDRSSMATAETLNHLCAGHECHIYKDVNRVDKCGEDAAVLLPLKCNTPNISLDSWNLTCIICIYSFVVLF